LVKIIVTDAGLTGKQGDNGNMNLNIPKPNAKLTEIAEFFIASSAFHRLKPNTQRDYESHLVTAINTNVEGADLGDYRCNKIKVRHITQAYETWLVTGIRNANYRKSVLSAAWKHAMRYDIMMHNPIALVKSVSPPPRRTVWEREQVQQFLETGYSDFRWRSISLIVHMAYDWGQRVGDMRLLTWDKLDLQVCQLILTQSKRNAQVKLPISGGLCGMLRQQKDDFGFQNYVAPRIKPRGGSYTPYDKQEISILINEILQEANLPLELTAMDLRRTAVTEMMEGGVDLANIMQVTGHKNITSVKPYMVNTLSGATKALAARSYNNNEEYVKAQLDFLNSNKAKEILDDDTRLSLIKKVKQ
jgi:integrase